MCYKSKFSQIVIILLDNLPTKVWSMKGLPDHNTCHISSCFPTHSQNAHIFIDFTNLIVICKSIFHEYVFDLIFLMNISNSLWKCFFPPLHLLHLVLIVAKALGYVDVDCVVLNITQVEVDLESSKKQKIK